MRHNFLSRGAPASVMLAALIAASTIGASSLPLPPPEASSSITVTDLRKHLTFLASDELGGRYTLSPSNRIAARYLASQLESYGYRGAARDGSFFQKVPLGYRTVDGAGSRVVINAGDSRQEFKYGEDFLTDNPFSGDVTGRLVFVGYGVSSPKNNYDDYAGLDVKGKIVVLVQATPASLANAQLGDEEKDLRAAASHGAAGAIIIPPAHVLAAWEQIRSYLGGRDQLGLLAQDSSSGKATLGLGAGPNMIKAIAKALGKEPSELMNTEGKPLQPATMPATAEMKMKVEVKNAPPAQNVAGILEGSDPKLKDEYVVFSAHYDHLKTEEGGEVYNGADDDGSGTASVLEIAQAFSLGPRSKRSVLIMFHTGEEIGLFGSKFNTDYEPVVPLEKLVADLNIDMVGRSRPEGDTDSRDKELTDKNSVYIIGADKLSTELNKISEQTNADTARMNFNYAYNDVNHPEGFYYRSDHYNYAKHGIPIIFYFTGVHRDYHRPTDDVDKIDFEKMERIDRMVFATGWRIANLDHRLVVDKKPPRISRR
ncbi:MAG: M28 family peptidase [Blastocatellia bacterium]